MTPTEDYYQILRVSPDADRAVIQLAYRALMRRYHPDVNGSEEAIHMATAVNEAYACLRDSRKRGVYDRLRRPGANNRRSTRAPSPEATQRPQWNGPSSAGLAARRTLRPTWWNAAGLGIATLVTCVTFTVTAATSPVPVLAAKPAIEVTLRGPVTKLAGVDARTGRRCRTSASGPECQTGDEQSSKSGED